MSIERKPAPRADLAAVTAVIPAKKTTDEEIERAVFKLNAICRASTLNFALAVGAFLVETFFSGDATAWRKRDHARRGSLRKLARHPGLAMNPGVVYRSIAMYEIAQRIQIRNCTRISTSHLRLVLPLLPLQQERLLRSAEEAGWSACRLEREVAALVQRDPSVRAVRGGRKRLSTLIKTLRTVNLCTDALKTFLTDDSGDDVLSPEVARSALDALRGAREACARAERRLEHQLPSDRTGPPHRDLHVVSAAGSRRED